MRAFLLPTLMLAAATPATAQDAPIVPIAPAATSM